jgi:hypothetical protein
VASMRVDPVCAAHDRAQGPLRECLAAAVSMRGLGDPCSPRSKLWACWHSAREPR